MSTNVVINNEVSQHDFEPVYEQTIVFVSPVGTISVKCLEYDTQRLYHDALQKKRDNEEVELGEYAAVILSVAINGEVLPITDLLLPPSEWNFCYLLKAVQVEETVVEQVALPQ